MAHYVDMVGVIEGSLEKVGNYFKGYVIFNYEGRQLEADITNCSANGDEVEFDAVYREYDKETGEVSREIGKDGGLDCELLGTVYNLVVEYYEDYY